MGGHVMLFSIGSLQLKIATIAYACKVQSLLHVHTQAECKHIAMHISSDS